LVKCYQICKEAALCCTAFGSECLLNNFKTCAGYYACGNLAYYLTENDLDIDDIVEEVRVGNGGEFIDSIRNDNYGDDEGGNGVL